MKTLWLNGLNPDEKGVMKKEFNASSLLRERLIIMLNEKIKSKNKKSTLETAYDNPNWAYLQADSVGYERAMEEVISLLS